MSSKVDPQALARALNLLPDVVLAPETLVSVMDVISKACGAEGAALLQASDRTNAVPHTPGISDLFQTYFEEGWHERDLRCRALPKMFADGIAVDQDFATPELIARDPYYNEFLAPLSFRWWAGLAIPTSSETWCFALQRSIKQGGFEDSDQSILKSINSPLSSACILLELVGKSKIDGFISALDLISQPAYLLSRAGRIVRVNEAAERLFSETFRISGGRVRSSDLRLEDVANRFSRDLMRMAKYEGERLLPQVIRLDGQPIYVLRPYKLPPALSMYFCGAMYLMLIHDLIQKPKLATHDLVKALYGLTEAEARLALGLAEGLSLADVAGSFGVSTETARSQLKSIFVKTDTNRQSALVRLMANISRP